MGHRPRSGGPVSASGDENKSKIMKPIENEPTISIRRMSSETEISYGSVSNILNSLCAHPYKPTYCQELKDGDDDRRLEFCQIMKQKLDHDKSFIRKMSFSDECNFHLNGTVSKHNLHYWSIGNPHVRHPTKTAVTKFVTVWALLTYRGGVTKWSLHEETMNGTRYIENVLIPHVVPYFNSNVGRNLYFQQDGAPCHYHNEVRAILNKELPHKWIGRRGVIEWPTRSPDLSVCDFFLWGYLRERMFVSLEKISKQLMN